MTKEFHVINGTGTMGQCDLYPKNSVHVVRIDADGIRWAKGGSDSIFPYIGSEPIRDFKYGGVCLNCENVFNIEGYKNFVVQDEGDLLCQRCHEKKTIVNR